MESETDEQWSWWETPDGPPPENRSTTNTGPSSGSPPDETVVVQHDDRVRKALIGVVALLTLALAAASYARFGPDGTAQTVASASVDPPTTTPQSTLATSEVTITSEVTTASSQPTTTASATTTTSANTVPSSTTSALVETTPAPPVNVVVVSTGPTTAEIRWESAECVGSLYQVGSFSEGRGGYPNVDRCWFNHVVLAGDDSFSPPLTPNTEYVVRLQAVNKSGMASDPVEVTFRTTSG